MQRGDPEMLEPAIGDVLEIAAHVGHGHPGDPLAEEVLREGGLAVDGLGQHLPHLLLQLAVEQVRLLTPGGVDDVEGECPVHRLVTEHQFVPEARPCRSPRERRKYTYANAP